MNAITRYLYTYYDEVEPKEFYRNIFPAGELQEKGEEHYGDGKYNVIIIEVTDQKRIIKRKNKKDKEVNVVWRHTLTDDLEKIDEVTSRDNFCLMSMATYYGKNRFNDQARNLYALVIEVDGIIMRDERPWGLENLLKQIEVAERIPNPTYIVSSGNGIHLYYVLEKPIPLFRNVFDQLEILKKELTRIIWHDAITELSDDKVQYEPITQGFRIVGTATKKKDKTIRARAFETGTKVTIEYLNQFVREKFRVTEFTYKSNLTLSQAKEKYPEWYQDKIIDNKPRKTWHLNRAVYEWWKEQIFAGAKCGHRYWCLRILSIYGIKCSFYDEKKNPNPVTYEELEEDVLSYLDFMDSMTAGEFEPFTEWDCMKALEGFNESWCTYPVDKIIHRAGIHIEKNRRNHRKQSDHLKRARAVQNIDYPDGEWRNGNGRKPKKDIVDEWRREHPEGSKKECKDQTGLSYPTIRKWWNIED